MDTYTPEQARRLAGLSQVDVANKLNISENAYINKEKGISRFYVDEACLFSEIVGIEFERIIFLGKMFHNSGTN